MSKVKMVAVEFNTDHEPEQSLQAAKALADEGARLSILHVKEEIPTYAITYLPKGYSKGLKEAIQAQLNTLAQRFENGNGVLIEGHSGRTILEWAHANDVDCIIIASHQPGLQDYLLGSTAGRVVRHAHCSVHVIR